MFQRPTIGTLNLNVPTNLAGSTPTPARQALDEHEARLRARYLKAVAKDISDKLQGSLHQARFIDLEIDHDPAAVKPPWGYYNPEQKQSYGSVMEAFEGSDRRLLLLGSPGAGKTTALLHIADALAKAAEQAADAPIPVLVNLSKFRLGPDMSSMRSLSLKAEREAPEGSRRFEDWLVGEMAAFPGLGGESARAWLREGRVAALLDGLDEFNDDRRAELATTLNATFLRHHADIPVVICSRSNEYAVLQSNPAAKLNMGAAVHLHPLTDEQVATYLKAAKADALLQALPKDEGLRELSRTPLTLSMLVLAYGGSAPVTLGAAASLSESRFNLFESYVSRMLQRQARRAQGVAFDNVAGNDVPIGSYCYAPAAIDRWLGWLALMLSVRMRTSFSLNGLTNLLLIIVEPRRQPLNFYIAHLAAGLIIAAALAAVATTIVPPTLGEVLLAATIIVAAWLCFPAAAALNPDLQPRTRGSLRAMMTGALASGAAVLAIAMLAHLVSQTLASALSPQALAPLLATVLFTTFVTSIDGWDHEFGWPNVIAALLATAILALTYFMPGIEETASRWVGSTASPWAIILPLWLVVLCGFGYGVREAGSLEEAFPALGIVVTAAAAIALAIFFLGGPNWTLVLCTGVASAAAVMAILDPRTSTLSVAAIAPCSSIGGLWAGAGGALAGGFAGGFALLFLADNVPYVGWARQLRTLGDRAFAVLDSLLLSRVTLALLASSRRLPFPVRPFLDSSADAFLLKRSGPEFEFVHRLLRDYFALRALRPRLASDHANRLETIRSLGYQGEAALDMLIEYVEQGDAPVRAAAISGLGHIPAPASAARIARSASDTDPGVRAAVIGALARGKREELHIILSEMTPIHPASEIPALLTAFSRPFLLPPSPDRYSAIDVAVAQYIRRMEEGAIDPLISVSTGGAPASRIAAIELLGNYEDDHRVLDALIGLARSRDPKIRAEVAASLGGQRSSRARDILEPLTSDPAESVRQTAVRARRIWDERHGLLTPHPEPEPWNNRFKR